MVTMKQFHRWNFSELWKDRFGGVFVYAAIATPVLLTGARTRPGFDLPGLDATVSMTS